MISKLLRTMQWIFYWYFFFLWHLKKTEPLTLTVWVEAGPELEGPTVCVCACGFPGRSGTRGGGLIIITVFIPARRRTKLAFTPHPRTPTCNAEDVEGLRLLHLPVQLPATHVGPVLQRCLEALAGRVRSADGLAAVLLMQGDADVGVGDRTGDCAHHAGLGHHTVGALHKPHLRI